MLRDEPPGEEPSCGAAEGRADSLALSLLLPHHLADLRRSGLTDETIRLCGFYSCVDPEKIKRILRWRGPANRLGPCLVIPFVGPDGVRLEDYARVKPDTPLKDKKEKPRKYESPKGVPNKVFFPPGTWAHLGDASRDVVITEGEKKCAAADQHGFPCLGLVGVYGWQKKRSKNAKGRNTGKRELIPELAAIALKARRVFIVFDSDAATNRNVRRAEREFVKVLRAAGANPIVVRLPPGPENAKQGLDDFILAQGVEALRQLLVEPPVKSKEMDHGALTLPR